MKTYPAFIVLEGRKALVVGGGEIAARKVEALLNAGAMVHVTSPEMNEELSALARNGKITAALRPYEPGEAAGYAVTVAATSSKEANRMAAADAEAAGRLVNVVDVPELCNFIVPSVIRRGELTVAISTGGASPALSRRIRETIEAHLPEKMADLLDLLAAFRSAVRDKITDPAERMRTISEAVRGPMLDAFLQGDEAPLREFVSKWT